MSNTTEIRRCTSCGAMVEVIVPCTCTGCCGFSCCGKEMQVLKENTSDGATEKHVPVVEIDGDKVTVKIGEVTHPMLPEHHIEWIILETKKGFQIKYLEAGDAPEATFVVADDEPVAAYEYCNLHGLWKKEI